MRDETKTLKPERQQAYALLEEAIKKLEAEPIDDVYQWMQEYLIKHPKDHFLALWFARVLYSKCKQEEIKDREQYDSFLLDGCKRALYSEEGELREGAAKELYRFYMEKEQYEQAERYLDYLPQEDPECMQFQAMIYSKTERKEDAYRIYEKLLYSGYQSLNTTFHHLYGMALGENDYEKAHMLVDKMGKLAQLFEFGAYHEISPGLDLAILEKDETEILRITETLLTNTESICGFSQSPLYAHMKFTNYNENTISQIQKDIRIALQGEDMKYLRKNPKWKALMQSKREDDNDQDN